MIEDKVYQEAKALVDDDFWKKEINKRLVTIDAIQEILKEGGEVHPDTENILQKLLRDVALISNVIG